MEANDIVIDSKTSASRKLQADDALRLVRGAAQVIVAKGKRGQRWDPRRDPEADIVASMLGSTGNLRAPLLRIGTTLLVGFDAASYAETLGVSG